MVRKRGLEEEGCGRNDTPGIERNSRSKPDFKEIGSSWPVLASSCQGFWGLDRG
jgi:hypothetical protein